MLQIAAVALVFLLLAGALWWFRGRGMLDPRLPFAARTAKPLSAEGRLSLGPQHALHLVRLGERGFLVATHTGGCALIAEAPWSELAPPGALGKAAGA
jgi:hypothetical protein